PGGTAAPDVNYVGGHGGVDGSPIDSSGVSIRTRNARRRIDDQRNAEPDYAGGGAHCDHLRSRGRMAENVRNIAFVAGRQYADNAEIDNVGESFAGVILAHTERASDRHADDVDCIIERAAIGRVDRKVDSFQNGDAAA